MTEQEKMKLWVEAWERAAPVLEEERRRMIRDTDVQKGIQSFAGMIQYYLKQNGCRSTSGLVEQQKLFQRLRA